jgi:RNA polymerase sigma-70 factor (ECF subfamily)
MPLSPEEQVLIDLWRQGDQDAARQIRDRYVDRLLKLAQRRLSQRYASRLDEEDIVQSAFRTFFTHLRDGQFVFEEQDDLCKLLVKITVHKTLRQVAFHKAAKRDPHHETDQGEHHREQLLAILDRGPTPEAEVTYLDQLDHLLAQLKPEERTILEMRLQGYKAEEIAKQLNVSDRTVRRILEHRIKKIANKEGFTT